MEPNDNDDGADEPVHETTPSTKLVKLWLVVTILVGLPVAAYFLTVRDAFGTEGFGGVAGIFVGLLTIIGVGRYVVRWLVLRRTTYVVTETSVRREYDLLYRSFARELPLEMLRSVELSRSRTETVLALGTVRLLTTGASRSMGYLGFDNVTDPEGLRDIVREQRAKLVESDHNRPVDEPAAPPAEPPKNAVAGEYRARGESEEGHDRVSEGRENAEEPQKSTEDPADSEEEPDVQSQTPQGVND